MRTLIVDDSMLFRKVVRDTLADCPEVEVIGVASDGQTALERIAQFQPDLVTLDIEMPTVSGTQVLKELRTWKRRPEVIVLSATTEQGAFVTTQALRLGAFDFVLKPTGGTPEANIAELRRELLPKIEELQRRRQRMIYLAAGKVEPSADAPPPREAARRFDVSRIKVVGIGISTGGPAALAQLLPRLPGHLAVPLVIVQHMPPEFTRSLAADLDKSSTIRVCEARQGQVLEPGVAYLAPGGKQMKIRPDQGQALVELTDDPAERGCKPSVDYLFRSLAHTFGKQAMGVVMTGMGDDGTLGCRLLKRHGCPIVAQEERSCVVYGMPRQVIQAGLADLVVPLDQLHEVISRAGTPGAALCP